MLNNHKIPKLQNKSVRGEELPWNVKVKTCDYYRNLMGNEVENETKTPILTTLKPNQEM